MRLENDTDQLRSRRTYMGTRQCAHAAGYYASETTCEARGLEDLA